MRELGLILGVSIYIGGLLWICFEAINYRLKSNDDATTDDNS